MEKAKKLGMLKDDIMGGKEEISPTARPTPIIGVSVRGSVTGGLPSGADREKDISPSKLGGYEKIPVDAVNSKLIDKTPVNTQINSSTPINDSPKTTDGVTHPFQIQKDAGEEPQAVTGASTDSDDTLTLKSAMPNGISIDVAENEIPEDMLKNAFDVAKLGKEDDNLDPLISKIKSFTKSSVPNIIIDILENYFKTGIITKAFSNLTVDLIENGRFQRESLKSLLENT
jgi:hypothetical protein